MTSNADKQTIQIKDAVEEALTKKGKIRILDYGAGKGRLVEALAAAGATPTRLDYFAYDKYPDDKNICLQNIAQIYEDSSDRWFDSFDALGQRCDDGSFDIIVLCNTLHEIAHNERAPLFKKFSELLADTGFVFIVEDSCLPKGGKPHQNGFLVLGPTQINKLFSISETDVFSVAFDDDSERLFCCHVEKQVLSKISEETVRISRVSLKEKAIEKITRLRSGAYNYKNGKAHAF